MLKKVKMSKENINLPKTAFSMKANLQTKEPEILDYWKKIDLYKELRKSNKGKKNLYFMMVPLCKWKYSYGYCIK